MKPSNFLHFFVIILLLSFTANEHYNYKNSIEQKHYNMRVQLSHLQRIKNPSEPVKAEILALKAEMTETPDSHNENFKITSYKMLVILGFFLFVVFQFMAYFRIDFSDKDDLLTANNYQRKTWLLNFFLFFTVAFWCMYFRKNELAAGLSYLVAVGSLVRSLMLATELRLITKKQGSPAFVAVTITTAVILYFNLILLGAMYYAMIISGTSLMEQLINLSK